LLKSPEKIPGVTPPRPKNLLGTPLASKTGESYQIHNKQHFAGQKTVQTWRSYRTVKQNDAKCWEQYQLHTITHLNYCSSQPAVCLTAHSRYNAARDVRATAKQLLSGVSKKFGEWYQKTNKTEDTNKLTLLAFTIIAIFTTHCWQRS
jgi:hypothetical protein